MTLIWVLLGILVLGGVAVVAAGRGQGLTTPEPDRPDVFLPPDRPLARDDVDAVRFSVGLRGYRMDEVDDVLDRLAADIAARDARIAVLEQEVATRRPSVDPRHAGQPQLEDEDELTVARTLIVPFHDLDPTDAADPADAPAAAEAPDSVDADGAGSDADR